MYLTLKRPRKVPTGMHQKHQYNYRFQKVVMYVTVNKNLDKFLKLV